MSNWPAGIRFITNSWRESIEPAILRSEMSRGPAVEAETGSRVLATVRATVLFETRQALIDFDTWYYTDIKRLGYFNMRNPVTKSLISARFVAGDIGELAPITNGFGMAQRNVTLEYYK